MKTTMQSARDRGVSAVVLAGALALLVALAACGKAGSPSVPPNSTFPKVYPANASRPQNPAQSKPVTQSAAFTPSGAWIDPNQHLPTIDPYADIDHKGPGGTGLALPANQAATPVVGQSGASTPPAYDQTEGETPP
jgi:hypothetical protein